MGTTPLRTMRARTGPPVKTALLRLGGYAALRRLAPSRRVAILRYHAICTDEGAAYADPSICVSPAAFEQHVRYLADNYAVLSLPEVADRLRHRRPLPRNAVVITFDDGYADNLEAARTLGRHGLSATFFITAGCLDGGDPFWPSEIRALTAAASGAAVTLDAGRGPVELRLGDEHDRRTAVRTLTRLCKSYTIPEREELRAQLRRAVGVPRVSRCMLTWDELAQMHRMGMTIGAHTVTHANLPSAGVAAATAEIVGSRARLERELGAPVTTFSYPNGGAERYYTPELQRAVADAGYIAAASSSNGFAGPDSDLYALERIEVEERLEDLVFALEVERFVFSPVRS